MTSIYKYVGFYVCRKYILRTVCSHMRLEMVAFFNRYSFFLFFGESGFLPTFNFLHNNQVICFPEWQCIRIIYESVFLSNVLSCLLYTVFVDCDCWGLLRFCVFYLSIDSADVSFLASPSLFCCRLITYMAYRMRPIGHWWCVWEIRRSNRIVNAPSGVYIYIYK